MEKRIITNIINCFVRFPNFKSCASLLLPSLAFPPKPMLIKQSMVCMGVNHRRRELGLRRNVIHRRRISTLAAIGRYADHLAGVDFRQGRFRYEKAHLEVGRCQKLDHWVACRHPFANAVQGVLNKRVRRQTAPSAQTTSSLWRVRPFELQPVPHRHRDVPGLDRVLRRKSPP